MKNIIKTIKILITLLLLLNNAHGQILRQGSLVITHSPNNNICKVAQTTDPSTNAFVVSVLDAANTGNIQNNTVSAGSSIPNRYVWKNATPINSKPNWVSSFGGNNWNVQKLGRVFGVTIDNNKNIYVSNSGIYSGEGGSGNKDKIWKIDGITGAVSFIWTSSVSVNTNRGMGNLKYFSYLSNNFIAVSNWEDGKIYFIRESSPGTWVNCGSFDPSFGTTNDNINILPYGLAIQQTSIGLKLFYGELNLITPTSNKVFSIPISYSGTSFSFGSTENVALSSTLSYPYSVVGANITPVSDISFSANNSRMVIGQQSMFNSLFISSHKSRVQEYELIGLTWNPIGKYPAGFHSGTVAYSGNPSNTTLPLTNGIFDGFNSAGGVTYWNNILFKDGSQGNNNLKCDTTILYTSDIIYLGPAGFGAYNLIPPLSEITGNFSGVNPTVYGVMGLPSKNNFVGTNPNLDAFNYSLKIDADDIFTNCDKYNLGDIEAYNSPLNCAPQCECGRWDSIGYNNNSSWWLNNIAPSPPAPTISFNQGTATGVLFPNYTCNGGPCTATFAYQITGSNGVATTISGSPTGGLNLGQAAINNLPCGSYFLNITPTCGNVKCLPIRIPIVINCPPACEPCAGTTTITQGQINVTAQNNISNPNPVSTVGTSFTLTSSTPVTEVRVLIDEFRVTTSTGNENCMLCRNKPQTWANINAGNLSGVGFQPMVTPATFPPALEKNIRELVFNNGAGTFFNLSGNTLNLTLGVPGVTGLNCCTLKAEVCIKFIIRDVNCCEKEILKCFTFNLQ